MQYDSYYSSRKQIPLAIEIPIVCIITDGKTAFSYDKNSFTSFDDFNGAEGRIAVCQSDISLWDDFCDTDKLLSEDSFLNTTNNSASVLLTSSSEISDIHSSLVNNNDCIEKYVFCDSDAIPCRFTYEWSLGYGNRDEERAAEMLLSWMIGNEYQYYLLMGINRQDILPICKEAFVERVNGNSLLDDGIIKTTTKFKFGG